MREKMKKKIIVAEYLEWFSVMFIVGQYFHVPQTPCFSF